MESKDEMMSAPLALPTPPPAPAQGPDSAPSREPTTVAAREQTTVPAREQTTVAAREPTTVAAVEPTTVAAIEQTTVAAREPASLPDAAENGESANEQPSTGLLGEPAKSGQATLLDLTQSTLAAACRRIAVSSSGMKSTLAERIVDVKGPETTAEDVKSLAASWKATQMCESGVSSKPRGGRRSLSKAVSGGRRVASVSSRAILPADDGWMRADWMRLVGVLSSPVNEKGFMEHCSCVSSGAKDEAVWNDVFAAQFADPTFYVGAVMPSHGVDGSELFDALVEARIARPFRDGNALFERWRELRAELAIAYAKYQNEQKAVSGSPATDFPTVSAKLCVLCPDLAAVLNFVVCAFNGRPHLRAAAMTEGFGQDKSLLPAADGSGCTAGSTAKRRRKESLDPEHG
jgi:hypothetical protein